ncbi:flavin monoamine oxidase family protein [Gelidibacter gilvus]|uniref:FAD-dependent oxidoreductase n=1 Tax=Gelidibacter gilvus TaxID=59602 RepID=A0A4Q0XF18_9FLAO|nr:NAD(P)/FAD-dependent oxidoreductase [Gelidibacter gilvus]RXJ49790.1 FAD-dependent oxidoreductase [Gelidibacter gilvus]
MIKKEEIIIIGGGLSGLTLAYLLSKKNIESTILEASSRLGGRIQTVPGRLGTPMELGATWFSGLHTNLNALLDELGLTKYPQYSKGKSLFQTTSFEPPQVFNVPESQEPSYRISGGSQALIDSLNLNADLTNIKLNTRVKIIRKFGKGLLLETANEQKLYADKVILCLPPQLVSSQLTFEPKLPDNVLQILPTVQTWMAGSVKFVLEYAVPFWRNKGYSGMLFSHSGIVTEMHDHTNYEKNKFGFTGFLSSGSTSYSKEVRKELVLKQLEKLLGAEASNPISYFDKVWTDEFVSGENQIIHRPHQNNGHPIFMKSYLDNTIFFSGTESSSEYSGYMEGAIISAKTICNKISI